MRSKLVVFDEFSKILKLSITPVVMGVGRSALYLHASVRRPKYMVK